MLRGDHGGEDFVSQRYMYENHEELKAIRSVARLPPERPGDAIVMVKVKEEEEEEEEEEEKKGTLLANSKKAEDWTKNTCMNDYMGDM